ncbi:putative neutral zinc metallopeptidase [Prevotella sp. DNF00663]|uniref:KPN_02809 family neutral zinc metallopeptidase n=1 Tax=Prevotella sp. DNF00663 TaxID=1384078 RepID=UPI00078274FD|nr:neutral zinc metallopeptidase [Prevotella sp. DNF00663]KXB82397.1 putative neutral zinc metallopeptidase [Prevotella sp. DNF00663]
MRLSGRRESNNVEDRRGMSGGAKAGIGGIGGIILIAIITFMSGGNLGDVVNNVVQQGGLEQLQDQTSPREEQSFAPEEQELAKFSRQILAGTEDVWTEVFQKMGRKYTPPTLVLFTSQVQSACGNASASVGPFYCSADQKLYIDLSFFSQMKSQLGAEGDFAYAYVIAHEVGHHVEHLLGTLGKAHQAMNSMSKADANKVSVRLELLADYYAGVWAHYDNEEYNSLEEGDLEEAINCAQVIGDNYLQEKARGYSQPESFTHGTSKQRMKWLKLGIETGDMNTTTFDKSDAEL